MWNNFWYPGKPLSDTMETTLSVGWIDGADIKLRDVKLRRQANTDDIWNVIENQFFHERCVLERSGDYYIWSVNGKTPCCIMRFSSRAGVFDNIELIRPDEQLRDIVSKRATTSISEPTLLREEPPAKKRTLPTDNNDIPHSSTLVEVMPIETFAVPPTPISIKTPRGSVRARRPSTRYK
jgi:hypothetical protein